MAAAGEPAGFCHPGFLTCGYSPGGFADLHILFSSVLTVSRVRSVSGGTETEQNSAMTRNVGTTALHRSAWQPVRLSKDLHAGHTLALHGVSADDVAVIIERHRPDG